MAVGVGGGSAGGGVGGSVVGGLEIAVGALVAAEDVGNDDDALLKVDGVEDAPAAHRNAEKATTEHQCPWRTRVLPEHIELVVDASPVSALNSAQLSTGVVIELKPKRIRGSHG